MSEPANVMATDLPYLSDGGASPFQALVNTVCFSSNDWGSARDFAWLYGIIVGWENDDPDPGEDGLEAVRSMQAKFGWTDEQVARLQGLHAGFVRAGNEWGGQS